MTKGNGVSETATTPMTFSPRENNGSDASFYPETRNIPLGVFPEFPLRGVGSLNCTQLSVFYFSLKMDRCSDVSTTSTGRLPYPHRRDHLGELFCVITSVVSFVSMETQQHLERRPCYHVSIPVVFPERCSRAAFKPKTSDGAWCQVERKMLK